MAVVIATEATPVAALVAMCRRCVIVLIPVSIALAKFVPSIGRMQAKNWASDFWVGVATHKNTLGQLCFVACVIWAIHLYRSARLEKGGWMRYARTHAVALVFGGLSAYLLLGGAGNSYSTTAVLITMLALAVFGYLEALRRRRQVGVLFVAGMLCAAMCTVALSELLMGKSLQTTVAEWQGKDPTLSGRTELWQEVMRRASERPLLGSGYGGFWTTELMEELDSQAEFSWGPQQAHNGYLETYAQLGLVGVAVLTWMILSGVASSCGMLATDYPSGQVRLMLLIAVLAFNYTEAGFPRQNHLVWFLFLVSSTSYSGAAHRGAVTDGRSHRGRTQRGRESAAASWKAGAMRLPRASAMGARINSAAKELRNRHVGQGWATGCVAPRC